MAKMFITDNNVKVNEDRDIVLSEEPLITKDGVVITDITDGWFKAYFDDSVSGKIVKGTFNPSHLYLADYWFDNPNAKVVETSQLNFVDHPSHYQTKNGIEVIDVIEAFTEQLTGVVAFDIGCAIKYMCRWKKKGGAEDLRKAIWYLEHAIKKTEEEENGSVHSGEDK